MIIERRQYPRKPLETIVNYTVNIFDAMESRRLSLEGRTLDVSSGGLCITADYPLEPGHVIVFGGQKVAGVVRWAARFDNAYKVGIKLVSTLVSGGEHV